MKSMRYILLTAVLSFAAACMEKELVAPSTGDNVPVATETLTICASLGEAPESDDPVSRTVIGAESRVMEWSNADYLYVFAKGTGAEEEQAERYVFSHKKDDAGKVIKGTFECKKWPAGAVPAYALFNRLSTDSDKADALGDDVVKLTYNDVDHGDNIIVKLLDEQKVRNGFSFAGDANIAAGEVVNTDGQYSVELKNLCGLIRFTSAEKPVSVTLRGNNNEMIAGGRARICFNEDGTPFWKMTGTDPGIKQVKLIDDNNLWDQNNNNQYFICILPPHTAKENDQYYDQAACSGTFSKGITLTVETASGVTYTKTSENPMTVVRNKVVNLGKLEAPKDNLVIELPMTADALPAGFPTTLATSGIGTEKEWEFTIGSEEYTFAFDADGSKEDGSNAVRDDQVATQTSDMKPGYYFDSTNNYFILGCTYAYVKFPAVPNMRLYSVAVSIVNKAANNNPVKVSTIREIPYKNTVIASEMVSDIDDSKAVGLSKDLGTGNKSDWSGGTDYTWVFDKSKANTSYYLQSRNGSVQLAKLVLTYVPVTE